MRPLRTFLSDHRKLLLIVLAVFVLTADDRHVGIVPDGRQMIWTSVAMTESGQLGQARGRDFTYPRAAGDSVSRYGMGMSLAQLPAAVAAPIVEKRFGPASSQPLFLLAPLVCTMLAAIFAGMAARELAHDATAERIAIVLTALGSPLAGYAAMEFSEPLQAAALAGAFAFALIARNREDSTGGRYAFAAGLAAGTAVLTKSVLLVVAPFALLPLLAVRRRLTTVAAGAAGPLALWLWFEIVRFGRPFAGYGGERFSHPLFDGLWRLLAGANKGIVLFFPALLVCVWIAARSLRRDQGWSVRVNAAAAILPFLALLGIAARWWAWHGAEGWGPRLVVPGVPLLAALVAPLVATWRSPARYALLGVSIAANALPLIQHPTPIATLVNSSTWPVVDHATAQEVADYARIRDAEGRERVSPDGVLAKVPSASPWVLSPWFVARTWSTPAATELAQPPWLSARPDITPELNPLPAVFHVISPRQWRFLGRGLRPGERQARYVAVYDEALLDQILRAQQMRSGEEALRLAKRLDEIAPSADSAVMMMESYRILRMQQAAQYYLGDLPVERRADPRVNLVIALFERDKGNEESARRFLEDAARSLPGTPAAAAVSRPLAEWPKTLAGMTEAPVRAVATE